MQQVATQCFLSKNGKAKTFVDNDMPLGDFHDYLMELKGNIVDLMVAAHKQEQEAAEAQKKLTEQDCCGSE